MTAEIIGERPAPSEVDVTEDNKGRDPRPEHTPSRTHNEGEMSPLGLVFRVLGVALLLLLPYLVFVSRVGG